MRIHDVTPYKEKGKALIKKVVDEINDSQAFVITPLPNVIKMRLDQYNSLQGQPELQAMNDYSQILDKVTESKSMMFQVLDRKDPTSPPMCVMEVQIEGGDYERRD